MASAPSTPPKGKHGGSISLWWAVPVLVIFGAAFAVLRIDWTPTPSTVEDTSRQSEGRPRAPASCVISETPMTLVATASGTKCATPPGTPPDSGMRNIPCFRPFGPGSGYHFGINGDPARIPTEAERISGNITTVLLVSDEPNNEIAVTAWSETVPAEAFAQHPEQFCQKH